MRDPLEELRNLSVDGITPALPASEVRRQGDRLRRRRTVLQATGIAAAVALVAGGGAMMSGTLTSSTPPAGPATPTPSSPATPAPSPEGGWRTTVPERFLLDDGLPEPGGEDGEREVTEDLQTPWAFDPCHVQEPGEASRTDYLEVSQRPLEQLYRRQLAVYPDAETAARVVERFGDDLAECPNHHGETGAADVWKSHGTGFADADQTLSAVRHIDQDGRRTTGAVHYAVVRVGNAVLVASYDGEFGAALPENVEMTVEENESDAASIAERMCVFSAQGCRPPEPYRPEPLPHVLDAEQLATTSGVGGWEPVDGLLDHPLVCAAESTEALAGNRTDTRQYAVRKGQGLSAMAIVTVLDFDHSGWRTDAYDRAARWVRSCARPVDREHVVVPEAGGNPYGEVHIGKTAYGPWTWRTVKTTAPEICEECDAGWNHSQGVALANDRLVLLQVSYRAELPGSAADPEMPFHDVLGAAADVAATSPPAGGGELITIGPTGIEDVDLGTSVPELQAMGYGLGDARLGGCYHLQEDGGGLSGYASDTDGVVLLWAEPTMVTPQRIGIGSTRDEVEAVYGPLRPGAWGEALQVAVPGHPGSSYAFELDEQGTVSMMALVRDGQACLD